MTRPYPKHCAVSEELFADASIVVRSRRTRGATGSAVLPRSGRRLQRRGTDGVRASVTGRSVDQTCRYRQHAANPARVITTLADGLQRVQIDHEFAVYDSLDGSCQHYGWLITHGVPLPASLAQISAGQEPQRTHRWVCTDVRDGAAIRGTCGRNRSTTKHPQQSRHGSKRHASNRVALLPLLLIGQSPSISKLRR